MLVRRRAAGGGLSGRPLRGGFTNHAACRRGPVIRTGFQSAPIETKGRFLVASETQGLAARYALALYELADEGKVLDDVASDLSALRQLLNESPDFVRLIRSPVLTRNDQSRGILAVANKAGANPLTAKFLGVLAANRRLFAIPRMIDAYLSELARRRGEVAAQVTSAVSLSDEQVASVTEALRKVVGQKVTVDLTVDPSLIGGLIVRVGSRMIDSSLRTKLQRLQLAMKGIG